MILMMPVSEILYGLEHLIPKDDTGVRLEGWIDARNTKNRYRNQLRNFSKVYTLQKKKKKTLHSITDQKNSRQIASRTSAGQRLWQWVKTGS